MSTKTKLKIIILIWEIVIFSIVGISLYQGYKSEIEIKNPEPSSTTETAPSFPIPEPVPSFIIETDYPELETKPVPLCPLTDNERLTVGRMIAGEAGNEPYYGKVLVAQCIYNAMIRSNLRPEEVRIVYKYSGWNTTIENQYPYIWEDIQTAIDQVFVEGNFPVEENILWFYAPKYAVGKFHNTQKFVIEVGGHRFYAPWD